MKACALDTVGRDSRCVEEGRRGWKGGGVLCRRPGRGGRACTPRCVVGIDPNPQFKGAARERARVASSAQSITARRASICAVTDHITASPPVFENPAASLKTAETGEGGVEKTCQRLLWMAPKRKEKVERVEKSGPSLPV